jgi:hypothetical protein
MSTTRAASELGRGDRVRDGGPAGPVRTVAGVLPAAGGMWAVSFAGAIVPRFCTGRARFWPAP